MEGQRCGGMTRSGRLLCGRHSGALLQEERDGFLRLLRLCRKRHQLNDATARRT